MNAFTPSQLEKLCVERGVRVNAKRRLVLEVIGSATDHPCSQEIYRRVVTRDGAISRATVYRVLSEMVQASILSCLELGDGRTRYEAAEHGHHGHLVDIGSGQVVEFEDPRLVKIIKEVAERLGYQVLEHRLEVFVAPSSEQATKPFTSRIVRPRFAPNRRRRFNIRPN